MDPKIYWTQQINLKKCTLKVKQGLCHCKGKLIVCENIS